MDNYIGNQTCLFVISTTPAAIIDLGSLFEGDLIDYDHVRLALRVIDWLTVAYFGLEYVVRLICSPDKKKFFLHVGIFFNIYSTYYT